MAYAEKRGKGEYPWRTKFKRPDGTEGSESGFRTRQDALDYGRDQEADVRAGRFHDSRRGEVLLDNYFWKTWLPAQRLSDKSKSNRKGEYRTHIAPLWGQQPLNKLEPFAVQKFENNLRNSRSKSTADNVMELLRFMCDDAVFAGLLKSSPVRPKERRGQREPDDTREGMVTTLFLVAAICARLKPAEALMVLVAYFTGMRWGEVSGMRRSFLVLAAATDTEPASGHYTIDKDVGAVHEDEQGRRYFGPPKLGKGRTVELPAFLVVILLTYLATFPADRDLLFVDSRGKALHKSNFTRRRWRPACDGRPEIPTVRGHRGQPKWEPIHLDLQFRDLRHTHKTELAEDGVEPVARDERVGHATPGMDGVYIHATARMRRRLLAGLERRWNSFLRETAKRSPTDLPELASWAA